MVRAPPCHGGSCGFESRQSRRFSRFMFFECLFCFQKELIRLINKKMPRSPISKKRVLLADPVYNSISINMLVNRVMKSGKKSVAYRIVYSTLKEIGETTQKNPIEVFEIALENVMPQVEVKPKRKAGAVQMVPRVLRSVDKGKTTALRWILNACEKKSSKSMVLRLKTEILDAFEKKGNAIKKKEELHKMAISNAMYSPRPQLILNAVSANISP